MSIQNNDSLVVSFNKFKTKMRQLIIKHVNYNAAKFQWIDDLLQYSKTNMIGKGDVIIGHIKIHKGKIYFEISREIYVLLFITSDTLYEFYWRTFSAISNQNRSISERSAKNKVGEFIRALSEVLCASSLTENDINNIYSNNFLNVSSLSINFETLDIADVYQRWQLLEHKVIHKKRCGKNSYSEPHEFCFICETEGEFIYVAILV